LGRRGEAIERRVTVSMRIRRGTRQRKKDRGCSAQQRIKDIESTECSREEQHYNYHFYYYFCCTFKMTVIGIALMVP
jgi:hypothetical protein